MTLSLIYFPEQSDSCDNMPMRLYNYTPVLPVNVSRPYFSTRPQDTREKWGLGTRLGRPVNILCTISEPDFVFLDEPDVDQFFTDP